MSTAKVMSVEEQVRTRAREVIERLAAFLKGYPPRRDFWQMLLSEAERAEIGEETFAGLHVADVWRQLHGGGPAAAVVAIAGRLGEISKADLLLLSAAGMDLESGNAIAPERDFAVPQLGPIREEADTSVPAYCIETGKLTFSGELIGQFQVTDRGTHFEAVLIAFEQAGWDVSVPSPWKDAVLSGGSNVPDIYTVVRRLNKRIANERIRLRVRESGQRIIWEEMKAAPE